MYDCIAEVESYLTKLEQLNNHADALTEESKQAAQAGEFDRCVICNQRKQVICQMIKYLDQKIEKYIKYRLPPSSKKYQF